MAEMPLQMLKIQIRSASQRRNFSARETEWLQELDGIELASFRRRAFAFLIDWALLGTSLVVLTVLGTLVLITLRQWRGHPLPTHSGARLGPENFAVIRAADAGAPRGHEYELASGIADISIPVLYFGVLTWRGRGCTPGKRMMQIRVISLVHRHLTLWHCVERALGYGAAALEGGFGFSQYFIHPYHRCVQDRIAVTIVVTERSYKELQSRASNSIDTDETSIAVAGIADESFPI